MRIAYFDTFSGIAGDMTLGALLDLGLPMSVLEDVVTRLELSAVELRAGETTKNGIRATRYEYSKRKSFIWRINEIERRIAIKQQIARQEEEEETEF